MKKQLLHIVSISIMIFIMLFLLREAVFRSGVGLSLLLLLLCLLLSFGIIVDNRKMVFLSGCFLVLLSVGSALIFWRTQSPIFWAIPISGILALTGIGLIIEYMLRTK